MKFKVIKEKYAMETIKLKAHIGADGILKLETPTALRAVDTEVLIVLQPVTAQSLNENGYPVDYFDAIDAIVADDLIERPEQGVIDIRDDIE